MPLRSSALRNFGERNVALRKHSNVLSPQRTPLFAKIELGFFVKYLHYCSHTSNKKLCSRLNPTAGKHKHRIPNMSAFACSAAPQTASAPSTSSNPSLNRIYSSERIISNKIYLRRLHINFRDAKILFFGASEWRSSSSMSKSQEVGAARYLPDETIAHTEVYLIDDLGRLWPVQYECVLRGGQRHSRLKFGWSKLCRANCFSVADRIQFHRFAHLDRRITINVCKVNFQSH